MSSALIAVVIFFGGLLVVGTAAYAGIKAAPWLPVLKKDLKRVVRLAEPAADDIVYDLGSGDGRVLIAFAHYSAAQIYGYEVSFMPYLWSRLKVLVMRLSRQVTIRYADFLKRDLRQATIIFCFLTPKAMEKLAPKFRRELRPGTKIISYSFKLPGWQPVAVSKPHSRRIPIYIYRVDG